MNVIPINIFFTFIFCLIQIANPLFRGPKFNVGYRKDQPSFLISYVNTGADKIKLAAYIQFKEYYKNSNDDDKQKLYVPLMQATIKTLQSLGFSKDRIGVTRIYSDALGYINNCLKKKENEATCNKWKALFLEACFFSDSIKQYVIIKHSYDTAYNSAIKEHKEDVMLKYSRIKLACKIQLGLKNKNIISKKLTSMFLGRHREDKSLDCITSLKHYESTIHEIESYTDEFFYLIGEFHAKKGENKDALDYLRKARKATVFDNKSRTINKLVQLSIEKLCTR